MKYIFNFSMIFLPSERTLSMLNNSESKILLSAPANRLLLELIKNKGIVIPRETLLKNVWEDYGFSGSNSNLNSYISEIRKSFILLGFSEKFIITVPKQGVKLEANIETQTAPQSIESSFASSKWERVSEDKTTEKYSQVEDSKAEREPNKEGRFFIRKTDITLLALFFFMSIIALAQKYHNEGIIVQKTDIIPLGKFKNCNIFTIEDYDIHPKEITMNMAIKEIEEKNVDCNKTHYEVYFSKAHLIKERNLFSFIGICLLTQKKHTYCQSLTENNGKEND